MHVQLARRNVVSQWPSPKSRLTTKTKRYPWARFLMIGTRVEPSRVVNMESIMKAVKDLHTAGQLITWSYFNPTHKTNKIMSFTTILSLCSWRRFISIYTAACWTASLWMEPISKLCVCQIMTILSFTFLFCFVTLAVDKNSGSLVKC